MSYRLRLDRINVLFLVSELMLNLFDLVLQDLQFTLLILELLRVDIDLVLKPLRLTLMNRVVATPHRRSSCN